MQLAASECHQPLPELVDCIRVEARLAWHLRDLGLGAILAFRAIRGIFSTAVRVRVAVLACRALVGVT